MRVLLTGAAGFVGANLVRGLAAQAGTTVVATDTRMPDAQVLRLCEPVREQVSWRVLDVRDRAAVREVIRQESVTHVIHGAALTPTDEEERKNPTRVVDVNLGGTVNVLDAALHEPLVERLLLISSSGVYGAPREESGPLQREEDALNLGNLYAITKFSGELLGRRYRQLSGKPIASLRFGAIYGPLERVGPTRTRLSHVGEMYLALRRGQPLRVFGREIKREWTYVGDVAAAVAALLSAPVWRHDVYNVSCGESLRFDEMVAAFAERGLDASWVEDQTQADLSMTAEQARLPMDISRLREDGGFAPCFTFAQGLDMMIAVNSTLDF
jgi:nucleoside-diphosphate-sugar epimerase